MSDRTRPAGPPCPVPYRFTFEYLGRALPVTNMIDVYGDETNDPRRAHSIVAYKADEEWLMFAPVTPEELEPRATESVN